MSGGGSPAADGHAADFPPMSRGALVLALLIATFLISYIDRHLLALLVAPVKASLGISDFRMSLLVGAAFSMLYAIVGVPAGGLADRMSRRRLIIAGILIWSAATIASGLAAGFAALFVARMAVGVGEAVLGPASYSMLGDLFPPRRLVRATALLSLAATLSAGFALIVGGRVIAFAAQPDHFPAAFAPLAPWQRAFLIVGLPGFVMALLFIAVREPRRIETRAAAALVSGRVFAYLWRERSLYVPIYACATGMAAMLANGLAWFPTHLIRVFGDTPAEAGLALGTVQIAGAVGGTALGLAMTELFIRRGHADGPLRTIVFTGVGSALMAIVFLMPTHRLTIALWLVAVVFQNTYYGNVVAALQLVTPSRARGTSIAVLYLGINLISVGIGSALIGALSQYVFPGDPRGIGYGLAIVGGLGSLLAAGCAWRVLPRYRAASAMLNAK